MALRNTLASWFSESPGKARARTEYIALVRRSRNPFFFRDCGVPDTLDGRFEIIVVHLFLALRGEDSAAKQLLLERFFDDMDRSLRESGVGDMGVGKRVQAMAEAAFGRLKAYESSANSKTNLQEALRRNVYAGKASEEELQHLTDYLQSQLTVAATGS